MSQPMTADTVKVAGIVIERLKALDEALGFSELHVVGTLDIRFDGEIVGQVSWDEDFFGQWVLRAVA